MSSSTELEGHLRKRRNKLSAAQDHATLILSGLSWPHLLMCNAIWLDIQPRPPFIVMDDWDPVATAKKIEGPSVWVVGRNFRKEYTSEIRNHVIANLNKYYTIFIGDAKNIPPSSLILVDDVLKSDCTQAEIAAAFQRGMAAFNDSGVRNPEGERTVLRETNGLSTNKPSSKGESPVDGQMEAAVIANPLRQDNPLTNRHKSILRLMAAGLSNKEIAKNLSISPNTIAVHISTLFRILNVNNRVQAINKAYELGILEAMSR